MSSKADLFVTKFVQWAQNGGVSKTACNKLPSTLRNLIQYELPSLDQSYWLVVRELIGPGELDCRFSDGQACVAYSAHTDVVEILDQYGFGPFSECLLAMTTKPDWEMGLRRTTNDETVYQLITNFLSLADQYIARSRMTSLMGAIALVYHKVRDFRPGGMAMRRFDLVHADERIPLFPSFEPFIGRERILTTWANELNALDPYVHRALFQFIRSLDLMQHDFHQEAIVVLDGVVSVASEYVQNRLKPSNSKGRDAMFLALEVSDSDKARFRTLSEYRSFFGAHPSSSKWWDFSDMYAYGNDDIEEFYESATRLVWKLAVSEKKHRVVSANPTSWSNWFQENAMILWDAVWYERIPPKYIV